MSAFRQLAFVASYTRTATLPPTRREVAIAGRSNAGKSSLINTLAQRKRLAFVSKTPGRTQEINYFDAGDGACVVDLPGYGFARVPVAVRRDWERLLEDYLLHREQLTGLVVVMDARHPLMPLDRRMLAWFRPTGKPVHVALTKVDRLTRSQAARVLREVRAELAAEFRDASVQLFSSVTRAGLPELQAKIAQWLDKKMPPVKGE
jgi:GTP-binding protein